MPYVEFEKLADSIYEMNRNGFLYSRGGITSVTIPDISIEDAQKMKEIIEKTLNLPVVSLQKRLGN